MGPFSSPTSLRGADLRQVAVRAMPLAGADLRGADLRDVDLARLDLRGADLRGADLRGATLAGADLSDAELEACRMSDADLRGADLRRTRGAGLVGERLRGDGARLDGAEWRGAALPGARFDGARAVGARFDRAALAGGSFAGANLEGAVFDDADVAGLDLRRTRLYAAAFAGARGVPALAEADLTRADLWATRFDAELFQAAGLRGARLPKGAPEDLRQAAGYRPSFGTSARRAAAHLVERAWRAAPPPPRSSPPQRPAGPRARPVSSFATFVGNWLTRALTGARVRVTTRRPARVFLDGQDLAGQDLSGRDLAGASLVDTVLTGARLTGADLRDADLRGAHLEGVDLTGARLSGARLLGARVRGAIFVDVEAADAELDGIEGLDAGQRAALIAGGARPPEEGQWIRLGANATAVAVVLVVGIYLAARFSDPTLDAADLEHAASEAQRQGAPAQAAQQFDALAERTEDPTARIDYLLEAAASAEEADQPSQALDRYEEALALATGTPKEAAVRLRRAGSWRRGGLLATAAPEYRAILDTLPLTPPEQAEALVGLVASDATVDPAAEEDVRFAQCSSALERVGLALALADGWTAAGHADRARASLERGQKGLDAAEAGPVRLRLARLLAETGDIDAAVAAYQALLVGSGSEAVDARLGAAELLARRGDAAVAVALLAPLVSRGDTAGARARLAAAEIAARSGDDTRAAALLQELLALPSVEPQVAEDARSALARILVKSDPAAAEALAAANPRLRDELRLGQARALREAGKPLDARALWVEVAEDPNAGEEARIDAILSLAELEVQEGDIDGALRRFQRVLDENPARSTRERVVLGMANALTRSGKLQEAEAQYDALIAANPSEDAAAQARLGLARAAELRGQGAKAEARYLEVGRSDGPWAVEALDALGQLRAKANDREGAIAAWRLARARSAGAEIERRAAIDIELAEALEEAGDPEAATLWSGLLAAGDPEVRARAAVAVGRRTLRSDPARARALLETALAGLGAGPARAEARAAWIQATVASGASEEALVRARAWLETETDAALRAELAVAACAALRADGRPKEALALAEAGGDGGFELAMERAGALRELGRPADALGVLGAVTPTSVEDWAWLLETRGDVAIEVGDLDTAQAAFDALAAVAGGAPAAAYGRARVARERGEYARALTLLDGSTDARAPVERANVLEGLGRAAEARAAWESLSRSEDPEQRSAGTLGLARIALEAGEPARALSLLDALGSVAEGYALTAVQVRGEALRAAGRLDDAAALYQGLGDAGEERVVAALGLGEVALARDTPRDALPAFQHAWDASSDPGWRAAALSGLARAQVAAGDLPAARATLTRLRREHPDQTGAIEAAEAVVGR